MNNKQNNSYKGKIIDSSQASTSKSKMDYGKKLYFSFKDNTPMNNERRKNSWKINLLAFTSKNPPITCYYCGLVGHVKLDCRKMMNDLKAQSYQENRRKLNKKNPRKKASFWKIENKNLDKKKKLTQTNNVKNKTNFGQEMRAQMSCSLHCS